MSQLKQLQESPQDIGKVSVMCVCDVCTDFVVVPVRATLIFDVFESLPTAAAPSGTTGRQLDPSPQISSSLSPDAVSNQTKYSKTSTHLAFSALQWFEKVRGVFDVSSEWFDCTEPSRTSSTQW